MQHSLIKVSSTEAIHAIYKRTPSLILHKFSENQNMPLESTKLQN